MPTRELYEEINHPRCRCFGTAAVALAAARIGMSYRRRIDLAKGDPQYAGGVGHGLPQEAPRAFAEAVVDVDSFY